MTVMHDTAKQRTCEGGDVSACEAGEDCTTFLKFEKLVLIQPSEFETPGMPPGNWQRLPVNAIGLEVIQ